MAKTQIKNYVFKPGIGATGNLYPDAYSLLNANKAFIQKESTAWIADQVSAGAAGFVGYTYNQAKCERDVGYIIDAYLNDLRYGGNEKLYNTVKYYWDQDVAQVNGDRQPEIQTHTFIGTLITNYILINVLYSASNTEVTQTIDATKTVETAAISKITLLVSITVNVITNGLSSLPTLEQSGISTVKFQGKYSIDELLLITNSTRSEVMYNFTNLGTSGSVEIITNGVTVDPDFPKFLQTTDGITVVKLNYDSSSHSSTDDIQIFVEQIENGKSVVTTRPFDFGTDAIERMRIAPPVSMLDADFEYGLQPTKWAAIATMRGYPSVYEIPGTDTSVVSVVSDASAGTEGIGQSLITVTTVSAHGFTAGTPITIKALEDSVGGAARAEGSFVIVNVPTPNTFEFYAKSKVGTVNPTTLSTTYTQLRQAGFYTGATIGKPEFTVTSNGSAGEMFAQLSVLSNSTIIPFDGASPEIGSPLTNANIPLGSQVTGIIDQSSGGGTYLTPETSADTASGQNQMIIANTTGIVENLAIDRGDGTAIYITDITGNTLTFNSNFTSSYIGNSRQYTGIIPDNIAPSGSLAKFDISYAIDNSFTYVIDAISNDGIQYAAGDRIKILGTDLGGTTPANDATITVVSVGSADSIASATIAGTHFDNEIDLINQEAIFAGAQGIGADFDVEFLNGTYTDVTIGSGGIDYKLGDVIVISGTSLVSSQTGTLRDLYVSVDAVSSVGGIPISTVLQSAGTGYGDAINVATTGGNGTGLTLDIIQTAGVIDSVIINTAGSGYDQFDTVTIVGGNSDATVRITEIQGLGAVTSVTFAGTAPQVDKTFTSVAFTSSTSSGAGAIIDVQVIGNSYNVTFTNEGINYLPTETITVLGSALGGATPANDLTITIDNVGGTGNIIAHSESGLPYNGDTVGSVAGINRTPVDATFDISQDAVGIFVVSVNAPGTGYNVGQELTVSGTLFGGESPSNDLTITVATIDELPGGTITTVTSSGSGYVPAGIYLNSEGENLPVIGTDATINVLRQSGSYFNIAVNNAGNSYAIGDRLSIPGASLGGIAPLNDLDLQVTTISEVGGITSLSNSFIEASVGDEVNLISTVTMSEATTGPIALDESITYSALATIEVTFINAHGLVPGSTFITSINSDDGVNNHNLTAGSYIATDIPAINKLRFQARAAGSIDTITSDIIGDVYPRPDSFFVHRPFDGGVQLGTGGPQHGAQAIRQSKKYIRYQSGKGIMYTTGALFAPSYDLRSLTAEGVEVGDLITVVTDDNDHGVQEGGIVRLLGVETPGYNSGPKTAVPPTFDYTVEEVVDERTFKIRARRRLGSTNALLGFGSQMSVVSWHGATVRSGIFDDQNGIFWEFDGTNISVNQRTGTQQLAGTIALAVDNNLVTGTNTRFTDQLKAGDRIIIKGMTHVVSHVNNQTEITVTPDWRGVVDIAGAKASLIVDKKVKQSEFNLDRLDGTGPSGYDIDIAKMQMIGIQYSWYGAGFIDFMLRGSNGNFVFAHRMRNSNVNTEAFMRSGNLPVRYEVTNEGPSGKLASAMDTSQTTLVLEDGSFFPTYGTVYIDNEIINFTGRSGNTLTGCIRNATFINFQAGSNRSYTAGAAATHAARTGVILISQTITPLISHWGSAFITDGGFDEDRGYIFSYAETGITVSTTKQTAFMIRLAPSVSNALTGDLGERELLNRAQLLLQGLEITSDTGTGGIVVEGVLNPQNYPLNPNDVGWSGLSGVAQGGQPSFAELASGGSVVWSTGAAATTATATSRANMTAQLNSGLYSRVNDSNYIWVSANDYRATFGSNDTNFVIGRTITGTMFASGTTITQAYISPNSGDNYGYFFLSRNTIQSVDSNVTDAYTVTFNTALTNRNFAYFNVASFDESAAKPGTSITGGNNGITVSANTLVNSVTLKNWGGNDYYEVQFNNSFNGTLAAGTGTITFSFVQPPYAQPGETVFSFIAVPGERSTLDLSALKELTNTPLGGRGTYPNGPDVLAINVYKVSGIDITSNIILRWGEAQA